MVELTPDLVKKHAEHNEGCLATLEEIALNQLHLTSGLDVLNKFCPRLKIVYLQGNLIQKLGKLSRMKSLEYLNVALNNLSDLEGLEKCESLKKLDVTANFIDLPSKFLVLKNLPVFEELFTTGNPCEKFGRYREYLTAILPKLKWLNGEEILRSERLKAELEFKVGSLGDDVKAEENNFVMSSSFKELTRQREVRCEAKAELRDLQNSEKTEGNLPKEAPKLRLFKDDGTPLNVNQSKLDFKLSDLGDCWELKVGIYKFLHTSAVDIDVETNYVRVSFKGSILQLRLDEEVRPDSSSFIRKSHSGDVFITMPKVFPSTSRDHGDKIVEIKDFSTARNVGKRNEEVKDCRTRLLEPTHLKESWRDMLKLNRNPASEAEDFVDDPSVPPLE